MQLTEFSLSNNNILPSFVVPSPLEEKHLLEENLINVLLIQEEIPSL